MTEEIANRNLFEANRLMQNFEYQKALVLLEPIAVGTKNTELLFDVLLKAGICCIEINQLPKAHKYLREGLELAKASKNDSLISSYLHELALLTYHEGRKNESMALCKDSIDYAIRSGDDASNNILHLAVLFQEEKNFDAAKDLLEILRVNYERGCAFSELSVALNELGLVYFALQDFRNGVNCLIGSIKLKAKLNNRDGIHRTLSNLQNCLRIYPHAMLDADVIELLKGVMR